MRLADVRRAGAGWLVLAALSVAPAGAAALQSADQAPAKGVAAAAGKSADVRQPAKADQAFDTLIADATAARQAEEWEKAIALYKKAVAARPDYVEGWWYQGAAYYSLDDFENCRDSFRRVTRLAPKNGAGYAFLGLCEFGIKEYDRALQHLLQSRILGVGDAPELGSVARYHAAVLMTRTGQYEQALETLGEFANEGEDNPRVIEAMGIATLRLPMLPIELPPDRREAVIMAGRASYMMATRNTASAETAFSALVARYPEALNVHYAYGVFLLQEKPDQAIEQFTRELQLQPGHAPSLMQLAFEYLNRGDAATALTWARQAVEADPKAFAARKALGQALLETGEVDGAIAELQKGIELAPESPSLFFQLARAYQRAGRLDEATKAREEFTRLDRLARTNRSGAQSVGGR
jgi:tetratricopeptide (TPR) repeat protein